MVNFQGGSEMSHLQIIGKQMVAGYFQLRAEAKQS